MHRLATTMATAWVVAIVCSGCASEPGVEARLAVPRGSPTPTGTPTTSSPSASTSTAPAASMSPKSASTSTTTTATEPPAQRQISMAFTGDILPHSPLWRQAARNTAAAGTVGLDFRPMLEGLAPLLDAVDLAVCHLETPIAPEGEEFTTAPIYGVPPEVVDAIVAAGYERCSTASNHTADRGPAGVDRTVDLLEAHGIAQSGMARTPAEIGPAVFDVEGVAVAHLAYTFSYNGLVFPDDQQWRSALIDPDRIAADVERARAIGAEVVVVSLHWGDEKIQQPTAFQRTVAEALTSLGTIDLIVGHHAHVLQPIEQVNGTWVVFGLGNVLSNMPTSDNWPEASQDAAVVTVGFTVDGDGTVTVDRPVVHPTWVHKEAGWEVVLVLDELGRDDVADWQRARLERSLDRTVELLGEYVAVP